MPNKRLTISLFIALVALPPANRLQGQIGGMIKKKVSERGLEAELDHRRGTVKRLASLKTPEQYRACVQTAAASPEAQKIMMGPANLPASATTDQVQKATEKMSTDLAKLSTDKCGEDPRPYDDGWRSRQVQAAGDAGAKAFAAGLGTAPGGGGP
jgi:hypothetical protein